MEEIESPKEKRPQAPQESGLEGDVKTERTLNGQQEREKAWNVVKAAAKGVVLRSDQYNAGIDALVDSRFPKRSTTETGDLEDDGPYTGLDLVGLARRDGHSPEDTLLALREATSYNPTLEKKTKISQIEKTIRQKKRQFEEIMLEIERGLSGKKRYVAEETIEIPDTNLSITYETEVNQVGTIRVKATAKEGKKKYDLFTAKVESMLPQLERPKMRSDEYPGNPIRYGLELIASPALIILYGFGAIMEDDPYGETSNSNGLRRSIHDIWIGGLPFEALVYAKNYVLTAIKEKINPGKRITIGREPYNTTTFEEYLNSESAELDANPARGKLIDRATDHLRDAVVKGVENNIGKLAATMFDDDINY